MRKNFSRAISLEKSRIEKFGSFLMVKGYYPILLFAKYQRLLVRRGKKKAVVTVAHSMLIAVYHVLSRKPFTDLGMNYYDQFNVERKIQSYLTETIRGAAPIAQGRVAFYYTFNFTLSCHKFVFSS